MDYDTQEHGIILWETFGAQSLPFFSVDGKRVEHAGESFHILTEASLNQDFMEDETR
jgi:hypothetical protein